MKKKSAGGFTLIELIITVAIIAILVATLAVALNPSEQLKRARDAKRVADLDSLKTALNLYLATATTTISLDGSSGGSENTKCIDGTGAKTKFVNTTGAVTTSSPETALSATTTQTVGAAGWLPARIDVTPGGTPIGNLPLDPSNGTGASTALYYAYGCKVANTYEITARLESTYFKSDLNLIGTDGGNSSSTYEVGSDLTVLGNAE